MGAACAVGITVVAHRPGAPGSFRRSILNKIPLSAMLEGGHKTNRMRGGHEGKHPQRWREGISANVGDRRHWAVNPIPCHERIVQLLGQIERREELGLWDRVSSWDESIYGAKTYVASYKLVLREEAVIRWLFVRDVFAEREETLEVVSDDSQPG
jgi:hypothetical protein